MALKQSQAKINVILLELKEIQVAGSEGVLERFLGLGYIELQ